MANIIDVAKHAGVSKTTVSKVLNNQYGVNEHTREKVMASLKKLRYIPNHAARSLVTSKSGVIGVIFDNLSMPIYISLAGFLEQCASKNAYNLVFCNCNDNNDIKSKYIHYFSGGAADGIVLFGSNAEDKEHILKLKAWEYPFVVIENYFDDLDINNILIDNVDGARQAVNFLIKQGHKKIVHISGNINQRVASDRLNGYIRALQENNLEFNPDNILYTNGKPGDAFNAMKKLLILKEKPTAFFAFNDVLAYESIAFLNSSGYKVPDDFSVIGFDDISNILNFIPANIKLSSMAQPMDIVAKHAIDIILKNIADRQMKPETVNLKTFLVEGGSHLAVNI